MFPCSPVYPTLAIDIRVLDFVRRLFLRIAPNYTAWCSAATDFLASLGYHLPGDDPLRRRFTNALQWYISLNDMATARIDSTLQRVRIQYIADANPTPLHLSPKSHCQEGSRRAEDSLSEEGDEPPRSARDSPRSVTVEDVVDKEDQQRESRKRTRTESVSSDEWDPAEDHTPLTRPSEYLRSRCALCFGGKKW